MAKRPDLVDITSITNSSTINAINQNWDRIQEAFDNTVSLDGSTPNAMNGDLDINGNALLNVGTIDTENLTLNGQQIVDITSVPEWRSAWVTATAYVKNDLVKTAGNVYICLESHTSGTFATDLTALKWELMVPKGDSGAGTGDLVSTNNLSDVADPATARANLSLGTVATENTVPVAKGGTGATDAATARTNLGVQAAGATLDSLEALSLVAGDVLYATGPDTLVRLPKGTAGQVLVMNSGATAPTWVTGGRVLLAEKSASASATLDFTEFNNAVYRYYEFELENVKPVTSAVDLYIRFSTNGGSTYDAGASDYSWSALASNSAVASAQSVQNTNVINLCYAGHLSNGASDEGISGNLKVYNAGDATKRTRVTGIMSTDGGGGLNTLFTLQGKRKAAQDTDAARFYLQSGNIASGTIRMYGLT